MIAMTKNDIIKGAIASLKSNQATETDVKIQELLRNVAEPKIAQNKAEYEKAVAAMKAEMEATNQQIVADCTAQAKAEVSGAYARYIEELEKLLED